MIKLMVKKKRFALFTQVIGREHLILKYIILVGYIFINVCFVK